MSHFTVLVRVPALAAVSADELSTAIERLLAPYQENNMGDCPQQYMEFEDEEDAFREEFETGSSRMVRLEDGSTVWPWDERFRVPGSFGTGGGTHKVPDHLQEVDVSHKDHYGTFEKFCEDYHGHDGPDEKTGRYGRWYNPNAKWDWYAVGGRWGGSIPVRTQSAEFLGDPSAFGFSEKAGAAGRSDACRLSEVDWDTLAFETRQAFEKWWREWQQFRAGIEFKFFEGPRDAALALGFLDCKNDDELTDAERAGKLIPWGREIKPGVPRYDVLANPTEEEARQRYEAIYGGLHPYAYLDSSGWQARGEMGWFGSSSATAESTLAYREKFRASLRGGDQQDWVVMVDCHI